MSDRPIIFSAPMVRALLAGQKTQTRRILGKTGGGVNIFSPRMGWADSYVQDPGNAEWRAKYTPYATGDRLYVREAWRAEAVYDDTPPRDLRADACMVRYEADGTWTDRDAMTHAGRPRPSIHMPRWASRLTLGVTEVRVQRLQEISEADAVAEGIEQARSGRFYDPTVSRGTAAHLGGMFYGPKPAYEVLWNSLHGPDAWDANPWVVAVSFTVEKRNIDAP